MTVFVTYTATLDVGNQWKWAENDCALNFEVEKSVLQQN